MPFPSAWQRQADLTSAICSNARPVQCQSFSMPILFNASPVLCLKLQTWQVPVARHAGCHAVRVSEPAARNQTQRPVVKASRKDMLQEGGAFQAVLPLLFVQI